MIQIQPLTPAEVQALVRASRGAEVAAHPVPAHLLDEGGRINALGRLLVRVLFADWEYHYSDDPRAYRKGRAAVGALVDDIQAAGYRVAEVREAVGRGGMK